TACPAGADRRRGSAGACGSTTRGQCSPGGPSREPPGGTGGGTDLTVGPSVASAPSAPPREEGQHRLAGLVTAEQSSGLGGDPRAEPVDPIDQVVVEQRLGLPEALWVSLAQLGEHLLQRVV